MRLQIDTLAVQSFATVATNLPGGPAHGHLSLDAATCRSCEPTCGDLTCDGSCDYNSECCDPSQPEISCVYACLAPPVTATPDCWSE